MTFLGWVSLELRMRIMHVPLIEQVAPLLLVVLLDRHLFSLLAEYKGD